MIPRGIISFQREKKFVPGIFTFKTQNGYVQEIAPQMIKDINEPIYQAKFMKDWKELGLRSEFLVVSTRISSLYLLEFNNEKWEIMNALTGIHQQRKF